MGAYHSHYESLLVEVREACEDEVQEDHKKSHSVQREVSGDQELCHEAVACRMAESKEGHQGRRALAEEGVCNHHSLLQDEEEEHSLDSPLEASEGVCSREVEDSHSHSLCHEEVVGSAHSRLGKGLLGEDSQHRGQNKSDACDNFHHELQLFLQKDYHNLRRGSWRMIWTFSGVGMDQTLLFLR